MAYVFQCTLTGFHKFLARNILNALITFFNCLHFSPYIPAFEERYIIHDCDLSFSGGYTVSSRRVS